MHHFKNELRIEKHEENVLLLEKQVGRHILNTYSFVLTFRDRQKYC